MEIPQFLGELLASHWSFERADGSTVSDSIQLGTRSDIVGYSHSNETAWRVRDGMLEFIDASGHVTTRFDEVYRDASGRLTLRGRARVDLSGRTVHVLKQHDTPRASSRPSDAAVLVRGHVVNEKLFDLWRVLKRGVGFDVFVAADDSSGNFPLTGPDVLKHSKEMCAKLGLSVNHERPLWWFGDYALYCSYQQVPDYEFYILVEYDVQLLRQNPLFIEGLLNRMRGDEHGPSLDYVAPTLHGVTAYPDWAGTAPAGFQHFWAYANFFAVSRRALLHLYESRKQWATGAPAELERWYVEYFIPTVIASDPNLKSAPLASVFPNSHNPHSFWGSHPPFLLGSRFEDDPRAEIAHPVYSAPEYLRAHLDRAIGTNTAEDFIERILFNNELGIPLGLRGQFFAEAMSRMAQP